MLYIAIRVLCAIQNSNFDFEYAQAYGQRGGDQLCVVSLNIGQKQIGNVNHLPLDR